MYSDYDIDYNKINMECMFVPDYNSGDNFYLFKRDYLDLVIQATNMLLEHGCRAHQLYIFFDKLGLQNHYICGETTKRNPHYDVMFRFTRYLL
jgi:hypothetical protein